MIAFVDENKKIFLGLYTSLSRTKTSVRVQYYKILEAQKHYFVKSKSEYDSKQQARIIEMLDDALHKFFLASFALEQLWGVEHYLMDSDINWKNEFDDHLTFQQDEITFLLSSLLDQVLYEMRSFLDFYLNYLLYFLTTKQLGSISITKFAKEIKKYLHDNPNDKKTAQVDKYIRDKVFNKTLNEGEATWGDLLKSLRDKTTHNKLIKPSKREQITHQGNIIESPTIQNTFYPELAQLIFENPAFEMLRELFPILYEFKWIPGPYREGMFG